MLSKCIIDGTKHSIVGGAVCIDGTIHQLRSNQNGSYVCIGGTAYHTLRADQWQILELGKHVTRYAYAGYESATGGKPSISLAAANTYFVFYMCNGYVGIYQMTSNGSSITSTQLVRTSSAAALTTSGTTVTPSANRYGSTIVAFTFDGEDPDDCANTLKDYDYVRLAGRNSATAGLAEYELGAEYVDRQLFSAPGDWWIQCTNDYFCMYTIATIDDSTGTYTTGLSSHMPSGNSYDLVTYYKKSSTNTYWRTLSLDSSATSKVHGGSIISCRRK